MLRLAMLAVLAVSLPAGAKAPPRQPGPPAPQLSEDDQKAIRGFRLTTSNTDKLMEANRRLREMVEKDPSLRQPNPMEAKTLDDSIKRIDSIPGAKTVLKEVGLSSREFVVGTFSMVTTAMWHAMKRRYPQAEVPAYVSADNLRFVDQHPDLIRRWSGMGRPQGRPTGDER